MDKAFAMRARKFSFDLPRLKLGPTKADNKALREQLAYQPPPDSPPVTPKSVRPPLPQDIEADLRNACAIVLQGFKPSTQTYEEQYGTKPQLDYAAIKHAPRKRVEEPGVRLSKTTSNTEGPTTALEQRAAAEELFRAEEESRRRARRQSRAATTRADQLMAVPAKANGAPVRTRSGSQHSRSTSTPYGIPTLIAPMPEFAGRPRSAMRTASMETTGSTPQTDSAEYPWSASTALTSAADTPAKDSKRTSAQAVLLSVEGVLGTKANIADMSHAREGREKHDSENDESHPAKGTCVDERSNSNLPTPSTESCTPVARMPSRKPVPASTDTSRPPTRQAPPISRGYSIDNVSHASDRSSEQATSGISRSGSRHGRRTNRGEEKTTIPQRAASRARSISRNVKDYMRSASRSRQAQEQAQAPPVPDHGPPQLQRSESRSRQATKHIRDYMKSASRAASRKPSIDSARNHTRSSSQDSSQSAQSKADLGGETSFSRRRQFKPYKQGNANMSNMDVSNSSDRPSSRGREPERDAMAGSSPEKREPNLNRKLPPLPGLDKWKDEEPAEQSSVAHSPASSQAQISTPTEHSRSTFRETRNTTNSTTNDCGGAHHSTKLSVDDVLAARMGAPVVATRKPTGMRVLSTQGFPPPVPAHAPPGPPAHASATMKYLGDFDYSGAYRTTPIGDRSEVEIRHDRRRSRSNLEVYLPTMPAKAHTESNATVHSQVVDSPWNDGQKHARGVGLGRSMSTRLGPEKAAPRQLRSVATSSNTPLGHSRDNSRHNVPVYAGQSTAATRDMESMDMCRSQGEEVMAEEAAQGEKKSRKKWWKFKTGDKGTAETASAERSESLAAGSPVMKF